MNRIPAILLALSLVFAFGLSAASPAADAKPRREKQHRWVKDFADEFNRGRLNENVWTYVRRDRTTAKRYMSSNPACYEFRNGCIVLKAILNDCDPADTARYLTGAIYTKNLYEFKPGRLEIRAKMKCIQGGQPAIWTSPFEPVKWPEGGEIDIMEQYNHGKQIYHTVWSPYSYTKKIHDPKHQMKVPLDPEEFHVYTLDMFEDKLVFWVDGEKTFEYPRIETDIEGQFPYCRGVFLFLDTQIIGSWGGPVSEDELPEELIVDYVRHYKWR